MSAKPALKEMPMQSAATHEQFRHAILPAMTIDEAARQDFVKSLKYHLATEVSPGNALAFENRVRPAFEAREKRPPRDHHEIRRAMQADPYFKLWSSMQRSSQEMMWASVITPVERQLDTLIAKAKSLPPSGGTLTLDPSLPIPSYHAAVDIHCMPGGYHTEFAVDDVAEGAIYDRAVYIYTMGRMSPFNDDIGASQVAWIKKQFPDLKPKRILDMGCTVGHSTIPYADAYPDAEIYGIDIGAPVLRYAHARAESLGYPVHYSQQNAEHTNFPDGFFDLIVSHIMVHETSNTAFRKIMKESQRLLADGGIVVHSETPPYKDLSAFDAFMLDWDTLNNNEPYWGASHELDFKKLAADAGFDPDKQFAALAPSAFEEGEARRTKVFQGGDFGGGGVWFLFGFRK
jgi:SAM-dependent methyltransferase